MNLLTEWYLLPVTTYILLQCWQEWVILRYKHKIGQQSGEWPAISIWVAARNEENNIADCLESLVKLDYPQDKIQILVGNDESTDRTGEIAREFEKNHPQVRVIDIETDNSGLKAKARVMAQIDKHANGEFYLITDADVRVNTNWAKHLILSMTPETGVCSGTTMVKGDGVFAKMQEMDWTYFMGLLNVISWSGVPATAVGNNMIVRASAYNETGGYSAIRFSITEDYKLYSEICKRGWKWNNIMSRDALATSTPVKGLNNLLHQRKRWLSGGKELPWYWWLMFVIFAGYYAAIPFCIFHIPMVGLGLYLAKFFIQIAQINGIYRHLGKPRPGLLQHLVYEIYLTLITLSTAIFFIIPIKVNWKGRRY